VAGWVVEKSNFDENPVVSPDLNLDFDLGFSIWNGKLKRKLKSISQLLKYIYFPLVDIAPFSMGREFLD